MRRGAFATALIAVLWIALVFGVTGGAREVTFDTFRDMAAAENILAGNAWADPMLRGETWWYAPGNPALIALVSKITGASVLDAYAASAYWLNLLIPVLLFLLLRRALGEETAWLALAMAGLGSMWWLTHFNATIPSIQGVALNFAALACWSRSLSSRWLWPGLTGLAIALSAWHHPLCAIVAAGAIGAHALLWPLLPRARRARVAGADGAPWTPLARAAVAGGVAALLAAPIVVHLATLPRVNLVPFLYWAPELHDPRYALGAHAPLVPVLGIIGAVVLLRSAPAHAWIAGYLIAGVLGQLLGYAAHDFGWRVPFVLPHEFQWHAQLALGICAAFGAAWLAGALTRRARAAARSPWPRRLALAGLAIAALAPALRERAAAGSAGMEIGRGWERAIAMGDWIRGNSGIQDVFACDPQAAYFLAGLSGRKVVALPPGHTNPAVDARKRIADAHAMLLAPDEAAFVAAARPYGPSWLMPAVPPGRARLTMERLALWSVLEPANVADSTTLIYRVRLPAPGETP